MELWSGDKMTETFQERRVQNAVRSKKRIVDRTFSTSNPPTSRVGNAATLATDATGLAWYNPFTWFPNWDKAVDQELAIVKQLNKMFGTRTRASGRLHAGGARTN